MNKTIAVDFDGVIHKYSKGWHDGSIYDGPVEDVKRALDLLRERGFSIVIFTCRPDLESIIVWCKMHNITVDEVTHTKPKAIAYIDDRGLRFTNWQDMIRYFV